MNERAYYNEIDPFAAAWLRELISAGFIAPGDVDERSIEEVQPGDVAGYAQCHFFAGIGIWSLALRLAGWPDARPVWTGSCPCPPFSAAGKRQACPCCASRLLVWCPRRTGYAICADCGHAWLADARHLWPELWRLIAERRPARVFGEQVASQEGLVWLAGVRGSLEVCGYALGAADLPAAGCGAPHIRQRLFWMADADGWKSRQAGAVQPGGEHRQQPKDGRADGGMGDANGSRRQSWGVAKDEPTRSPKPTGRFGRLANPNVRTREQGREIDRGRHPRGNALAWAGPGGSGDIDRMGHADGEPGEWRAGCLPGAQAPGEGQRLGDGYIADGSADAGEGGLWRAAPIHCDDGKLRRVPCDEEGRIEPAFFPLVDAGTVRNRVGLLRGSGNAISPFPAAAFIEAVMEAA